MKNKTKTMILLTSLMLAGFGMTSCDKSDVNDEKIDNIDGRAYSVEDQENQIKSDRESARRKLEQISARQAQQMKHNER